MNRRAFIAGLLSTVAAPAIARAGNVISGVTCAPLVGDFFPTPSNVAMAMGRAIFWINSEGGILEIGPDEYFKPSDSE